MLVMNRNFNASKQVAGFFCQGLINQLQPQPLHDQLQPQPLHVEHCAAAHQTSLFSRPLVQSSGCSD